MGKIEGWEDSSKLMTRGIKVIGGVGKVESMYVSMRYFHTCSYSITRNLKEIINIRANLTE